MIAPVSQLPLNASPGAVAGAPAATRVVAAPATSLGAPGPQASFAASLESALQSVSRSQNEASALQRQYQAGVPGVSLEQTMVAMQKAQVGFQAALAVRNRLVSAYSDIMNMQV